MRIKSICRYSLIVIFSALLAGEIILRIFFSVTKKDIKAFDQNFGLYQGHPFVGYIPAPGYKLNHDRGKYSPSTKGFTDPLKMSVGSLGFRGEEFSAKKKEATFRIFCLGGSDAWGLGVDDDEAFPVRLQKELQKNSEDTIEVINAGVPGYTTFHSLCNLSTRILDFNPNMIIIYHSWNDLKYMSYLSEERQFGSMALSGNYQNPSFLEGVLHRSYSYIALCTIKRLLGEEIRKRNDNANDVQESFVEKEKSNSDIAYGLSVYKRNLLNIIAIAKANQIQIVMVNPLTLIKNENPEDEILKISYQYTGLSLDELRVVTNNLDKVLGSIAEVEKIKYINLNNRIPSNLNTMMDHIHPTQLGHELIAEQIALEIEGSVLLQE